MNYIIGGRRTGKTTKLIKYAAENNGLIITNDERRVKEIEDIAKKLGYTIQKPVTIYELKQKSAGRVKIVRGYMDDADSFLEEQIYRISCGYIKLDTVTMTLDVGEVGETT